MPMSTWMQSIRRILPCAVLACLLSAAGASPVPSQLLKGRDVAQRLAPAVQPGPEPSAAALVCASTFTLSKSNADQAFALVLDGARPEDNWTLSINGAPFEYDGLFADGAAWYQIPPHALRVGDNTITATPTTPAKDSALKEIVVFSLENTAEEDHFVRLIPGRAIAVQPPTDPAQDKMDVLHCDLAITLDMTAPTIPAATLTLTAKSLDNSLATCVLDFDDNAGSMVVDSVDSGPSTPALPFTHNGTQDRLFITLPAPIPAGNTFTVRVAYHGAPRTNAPSPSVDIVFRRVTHGTPSAPLVYTYSQPYDARRWWPCKDVPDDKFTIDLHVTCPDASYNGYPLFAVTNGALQSVVDNGSTLTYNYAETYPVSTQYVSITCTNYRPSEALYTALDGATTMSVCHQVYPESWAAESGEVVRTIEVMDFFADTFGEYPFLNTKYWTSTWSYGGGMEHQTCTSMPNGNLATPYHRRNIHELAHMWFGDAVGIRHFDHLWISEGWGTYCEALWKEHKEGIASYHAQMASWSTSDAVPIVSSSADSFTFSITYYKGAWVLHMLRHVIGDTPFFQGARNYMADANLRYGAALTSDLQQHFEITYGQSLAWFFDQWCYRASRPNYTWGYTTSAQGSDTIVHLGIQQNQADAVYEMPVDIRVTYQGGATADFVVRNDQRIQNFAINAGAGTVTGVAFDPDNWILDIATHTPITAPSTAPTLLSVKAGPGSDRISIAWSPYSCLGLAGFRLYQSLDGATGWTLVQNESVLGPDATSAIVTGLAPGDARYFRLTAVAGGGEGPYSDAYGARIPSGAQGILIVDGYDRWNSQTAFSGGLNHAIAASHGRAVAAYPQSFDTCANEAAGDSIQLTDYDIVIWICGDESTADETFSAAEQALVRAFLEDGGKLFVSGNEIGWDLGRATQPQADQDFYHDYLKANYVADNSADYTVTGTPLNSIFFSVAYSFGSGDAPYQPGYPDVISANGSTVALEYSAGVAAAIQYFGTFGLSGAQAGLVHAAFAFETLDSEAQRIQFMGCVLDAFIPSGPPSDVRMWVVY